LHIYGIKPKVPYGVRLAPSSPISPSMYVGVHACMCEGLRLTNDFINVNTETKLLICCEEISTFYGNLDFYWGYKFDRGSCLICLICT